MTRAPWLLVLALAATVHADPVDPAVAQATPAERALLDLLEKEKYIKARDEAEKILEQDPKSFVATWAMARIQHDEEGNHARSLYYVRRAAELFHDRWGASAEWDKKLLVEEYYVDHEMDRMTDALEVVDRMEQRFGRAPQNLRIWPLFKLGRMDEAREIGRKLAVSDDPQERLEGHNGMLALEFEAHDRSASWKWAMDGVAATQSKSCILLRNAAGVAYVVFRLREAEELALRAHEVSQDCDGAGYDQLAGLYLVEGEFAKAIEALKSLRGTPIQKRYRPHYALQRRSILADIMYALGKTDDAERLSAEVYSLPERLGMISTPKRHADFIRAFRYWMALDTKIAHEAEKSSYRAFADSWSYDDVTLPFTRWTLRRLLIQLLADDDFLISITRPNLGELFQHASWRNPGLIEVLGTGVMSDAVAAAREADTEFPQATPFYDLFDAEISFHKGNLSAAVDAATAALAKLPREEAMLRWRTLAWQAEALRREGKLEAARPLFHEVLQKAPSLLRIVDAELPVTITDDGSPLAVEAAHRVRHSPRFDTTDNAPFKISTSSKDGVVEVCLTDDGGFSFGCSHGDNKGSDDDAVVSALDAFHDAAFTPKIALEQSDLNSLDGSPTRATADHMLKGLVEP